jgi:hypothetical protein
MAGRNVRVLTAAYGPDLPWGVCRRMSGVKSIAEEVSGRLSGPLMDPKRTYRVSQLRD